MALVISIPANGTQVVAVPRSNGTQPRLPTGVHVYTERETDRQRERETRRQRDRETHLCLIVGIPG